jgi:magnesium-transporting ATPase (P-type)
MPMKKDILERCVNSRNQLIAEGSKDDAGAHDIPSPIMLSGSKVLSGEGKMVIIAVGKLSALGKIQDLLGHDEETPTPL